MINTLEYEAEFPASLIHPSGRVLRGKVDFQKGLTLITGANEAGKSFSLEMIRFGLFGASALRSKTSDYTRVEMKMEFKIRGETYLIDRTLRKAVLTRAGNVVATGVSPVNEKLVKLLGFGLEVFDVACSANQDDLLRITSMRPTERRRLVDTVVGIGALEVVGKWAAMEASLRERDAKTIRSVLVTPSRPHMPTLTFPPTELRQALAQAELDHAELQQVKGWLSQTRAEPMAPACPIQIPSENLRGFAEERKSLRLEIEHLKARIAVLPAGIPVVTVTREKIAAWEAYRDAQARLRVNQPPSMPLNEAAFGIQQWGLYNIYAQTVAANAVYERQIKLLTEQALSCPNCQHTWHTEQDRIEELQLKIQPVCEIEKPGVTLADYTAVKQHWQRFDQAAYDRDIAVPEAPNPGLTLAQLEAIEGAARLAAERMDLEPQLAALQQKWEKGKDWEGMLSQRLAYEASLKVYHQQRHDYELWLKERAEKIGRQTTLMSKGDNLERFRREVASLDQWERDNARYDQEAAAYMVQIQTVEKQEAEAGQFRLVAEAMTRVRTKVKQFLLPSLNRVASALLARMTGGARTSIIIDEEFEILVDGQKVETLSGSGKACANLAIRIALGQVLVAGVMSVFLGDEIDGSMDAFRAEETSLTLRDLVNSVSQIIIVSHKSLEADHTVVIGA